MIIPGIMASTPVGWGSGGGPGPGGCICDEQCDNTWFMGGDSNGESNADWDAVNGWWVPHAASGRYNLSISPINSGVNAGWQVGFRPTQLTIKLNSGPTTYVNDTDLADHVIEMYTTNGYQMLGNGLIPFGLYNEDKTFVFPIDWDPGSAGDHWPGTLGDLDYIIIRTDAAFYEINRMDPIIKCISFTV